MVNQQSVVSNKEANTLAASRDQYVVGVDIGGTSLRVALADANGTIVAKWSSSTVGIRDAKRVVDLIAKGVDQLLLETAVSRNLLRGIGAGAPGVTDVDAGVVIATSYLMGWKNVPLGALLEDAVGVAAVVDNDVNLAALGERYQGVGQTSPDFVFLALGTGLGAGIVLNGQLLRGSRWSAGELGYMLVPGVSADPVGHNTPGALESMIGGEGIRNQWQLAWREGGTPLSQDLVATEVFNHALKGDAIAKSILDQTARFLAYGIYNVSLVLNCPLFVLGGSVGLHPALSAATRAVFQQWSSRMNPEIVQSSLGVDAQLVGAIHLALTREIAPATVHL